MRPNVKVRQLEEAYGIEMKARPDWTLAEAIRNRLEPQQVQPDSMVQFGPIVLHVRVMGASGDIEQVGMVILPTEDVA